MRGSFIGATWWISKLAAVSYAAPHRQHPRGTNSAVDNDHFAIPTPNDRRASRRIRRPSSTSSGFWVAGLEKNSPSPRRATPEPTRGIESRDPVDAKALQKCGDVHPNPGPGEPQRPQQRPYVSHRRGHCQATSLSTTTPTTTSTVPPTNSTTTISVLHANIVVWNANQAEIGELLHRDHPDLVLLQETNLRPSNVVKIRGYACVRRDRVTPRDDAGPVKGGGVMILVRSDGPRPLSYTQLPPLPHAPNDITTEAVGV